NQMPSGLLTDGAMILFAAALLLAPGLITDLFGLTLLIPFSRNWYKTWAVKWMKSHFKVQVTAMGGQKPFQSSDIIDGEVVSQTTDEKDSTVNKTSHLVH
ncbi:MAG: FxsA family protein, partial [Planctomycetota bacterium]